MLNLSWRVKLLGLFTLVLGAALIFQLLYVIPTVRNQQMEVMEAALEDIAFNIAWQLEIEISALERTLLRLAERAEFRNMDIGNQQRTVNQIAEVSPDISSIYVMDAEGWFVAGTADDLSVFQTKSYTDKPYYTATFEQGQVYFAAPRAYLDNTLITTAVSVPIESDTGERVGLLLGTMNLTRLIENVTNYPVDEEVTLFMVDSEGTVLAHSEMDLSALEGGPLSLNFSDKPIVQALQSPGIHAHEEYEYDGVSYFGVHNLMGSTGWGVVVEIPMYVIQEKTNRLGRELLWVNISLFVAALAVTLVFSNQIMSERKKTEVQLRLSEEKYRLITETSVDSIYQLDTSGIVLFMNDPGARMFGYTTEEVIGKSFSELVSEACLPEATKLMETVLAGKGVQGEISAKHKNGQEFPVRFSAVPLKRDGKIVGFTGVAGDITERKRAEDVIQRVNDHLQIAIDNMPNAYILWDPDLRIIEWSKSAERIFGYSKEEMLGKHAVDFIVPKDARTLVGEVLQKLKVGEVADYSEENNNIRKDGEVISCHWYNTPLTDEDGKVFAILTLAQDITERVHAEKTLRDSEERFRSVAETAIDAIISADGHGTIIYWNNAAETVFGFSAEEVIGKPVDRIVPERLRKAHRAGLERVISTGETKIIGQIVELVGQRKDGSEFSLEMTLASWNAESEQFFTAIIRDITERKQMEEQLRHSQVLASLGEMTAGIAHEVGNPLASIVLYSEVARKAANVSGQTKKDLKVIHDEAKRAGNLMKDLLAYSRKLKPRVRRVNVHTVIERVFGMLQYQANVQNINISTDLLKGTLNVNGDPDQLTQVFMNLILNAIEAVKGQEEGNITVKSRVENGWVKITVTDDGPGIPKEYLDQIFMPFFTTKAVGEGTGLGLSTCYGIIFSHDGLISAENNENGGATFTVELPVYSKQK